MPAQSRLGHKANVPSDGHGCNGCTHNCTGPAVGGSPNVNVNSMPGLRKGDPGIHSGCCGPNTWNCKAHSGNVNINGKGAVRNGDATAHCGGTGNMTEGSGNVNTGG